MKTITITKDDVLTAIETEPVLIATTFWDPRCGTCAVGAVLRQRLAPLFKGLTYQDVDNCGYHVTEVNCTGGSVATPGNWLSALSIVWEYMNEKYRNDIDSPEDLRWNIWEWAEENIPEDWEYELVVNGGVA